MLKSVIADMDALERFTFAHKAASSIHCFIDLYIVEHVNVSCDSLVISLTSIYIYICFFLKFESPSSLIIC